MATSPRDRAAAPAEQVSEKEDHRRGGGERENDGGQPAGMLDGAQKDHHGDGARHRKPEPRDGERHEREAADDTEDAQECGPVRVSWARRARLVRRSEKGQRPLPVTITDAQVRGKRPLSGPDEPIKAERVGVARQPRRRRAIQNTFKRPLERRFRSCPSLARSPTPANASGSNR